MFKYSKSRPVPSSPTYVFKSNEIIFVESLSLINTKDSCTSYYIQSMSVELQYLETSLSLEMVCIVFIHGWFEKQARAELYQDHEI